MVLVTSMEKGEPVRSSQVVSGEKPREPLAMATCGRPRHEYQKYSDRSLANWSEWTQREGPGDASDTLVSGTMPMVQVAA